MSANNESNYTPKPPTIPSAGSKIPREDCLKGTGLDGWVPSEKATPGSPADDYNADIFKGTDGDAY